jgi:hypothetical protein
MFKINTKFIGRLIGMALLLLCLSAEAQLLPIGMYPEAYNNYFPGNYYRTCHACNFQPNSGILSCQCLDKNQQYTNQPTHMYVSHQCGYIQNINGNLVCTDYVKPNIPTITRTISAGPIWNNNDAKHRCHRTCHSNGGHWNGQWWTTDPGTNSVCQCKYPKVF